VKDADFFDEISPARNVQKIKAPLFVLQGANDPIVPATESEQIVKKIKANGGTVKYLLLPDEGHGLSKLSNRIHVHEEMLRFLDQVLSVKKER
jgi:dipeptidyl aminopeptidase/acylaminoacyl peptidase